MEVEVTKFGSCRDGRLDGGPSRRPSRKVTKFGGRQQQHSSQQPAGSLSGPSREPPESSRERPGTLPGASESSRPLSGGGGEPPPRTPVASNGASWFKKIINKSRFRNPRLLSRTDPYGSTMKRNHIKGLVGRILVIGPGKFLKHEIVESEQRLKQNTQKRQREQREITERSDRQKRQKTQKRQREQREMTERSERQKRQNTQKRQR